MASRAGIRWLCRPGERVFSGANRDRSYIVIKNDLDVEEVEDVLLNPDNETLVS